RAGSQGVVALHPEQRRRGVARGQERLRQARGRAFMQRIGAQGLLEPALSLGQVARLLRQFAEAIARARVGAVEAGGGFVMTSRSRHVAGEVIESGEVLVGLEEPGSD